jgi:hypothetical protein
VTLSCRETLQLSRGDSGEEANILSLHMHQTRNILQYDCQYRMVVAFFNFYPLPSVGRSWYVTASRSFFWIIICFGDIGNNKRIKKRFTKFVQLVKGMLKIPFYDIAVDEISCHPLLSHASLVEIRLSRTK